MSPKTVALGVMRGIGLVAGLVPRGLRTRLVFALLVLESRIGRPDDAMRQLYHVQDDLERILAERAMAYGDGIHPKHRLTRYHEFFVDRIGEKARVLDIGCGYGEVARAIARARPNASVAGVEIEADHRYLGGERSRYRAAGITQTDHSNRVRHRRLRFPRSMLFRPANRLRAASRHRIDA